MTLILARALSRTVQSIVTLLRTWVTSSAATTFELVLAHRFDGAVVRGEGVVKRDFVVIRTKIDAALSRGAHLFGELACRAEAAAKAESALR